MDQSEQERLKSWLSLTHLLRKRLIAEHEKWITVEDNSKRPAYEQRVNPSQLDGSAMNKPQTVLQAYFYQLEGVIDAINDALPKAAKPKDPIEQISHQVNFVVAMSGSLGPNWSLVRFKGPSNPTSLMSATRNRTHGLVITLGPSSGDAAKNARAAASISSALKANGVILAP